MQFTPEHGGDGERLDHGRRQLGQAASHRLPDAGGDGAGRVVGVPQPRGLLDEERVAAGAAMHLVDETGVGLPPGGPCHQRGDLVAGEAGEGDAGGLRDEGHQQGAQRVLARLDLGVTVGADQQ